jgi:hypothetical protein
MYDGKLTQKKRVAMSEEMAREIELLSESWRRPFQDQARVLLELGLQAHKKLGKGPMGALRRTRGRERAA